MRKISTLLTMLFLLCGVCMAQSSRVVYLKTDGRANGRYMSVNATGGLGSVAEKDNSALWVLNPVSGKADTYTLQNASNVGYVEAYWSFETQWHTVANASQATEFVLEDLGGGKYGFRKPDAESGDYYYAHLAGDLARIVIWESGESASQWSIEDVEGEARATVLSNMQYISQLEAAVANAETNYANTLPTPLPLITSASQFNSNNKENTEGSYEALLDGDNTTFFHSNWHGGGVEPHDLQVMLNDNSSELKEFTVKYMARKSGSYYNNRPSAMNIYGGKEVNGAIQWNETAFAVLGTADGLGELEGEFSFTADDVYDAFRFEVTSTAPTNYVYFTYGEFQMYSPGYAKPAKYITATDEDRAALAAVLEKAANADLLTDNFKELTELVETTVAEVRENLGGESLDLLLVIDEAKAKLEALTTYENTPGQLNEEGIALWEEAIAKAEAVYGEADKDDATSLLNCVEAQCQLERFMAANTKSNVDVDIEALTDGFFTIENPNRGAVVYIADKDTDPSHTNYVEETEAPYVWYTELDNVNANYAEHLWGFYQNQENGEIYLYNVATGLFANPMGNGEYGLTWILSQVPSPIKLEAMEAPYVRIIGSGETMSISTSYTGPVITYYAEGDAGVPFQFKRAYDSNSILGEDWAAELAAQLDYNVNRPHLIDPLRGYIDFLWDMMASEKEHSAEPGHLNADGLAKLDDVIAWANEQANFIVITDHYEDAAHILAELKASTAAIYAAAANYTKPESGKYYTIKSDNSSDEHYHLAHFLIQNAANDFLVVANSTGEFEKTAWRALENKDGSFSFTNNNRYLAFGETTDEEYSWTLGAPQRSDVFENNFGSLTLYGVADGKYLAVNAETSSVINEMPTNYIDHEIDVHTGDLSHEPASTSSWYGRWTSADGKFKLEAPFNGSALANNMQWSDNDIACYVGTVPDKTWKLVASNGDVISGFTMKVALMESASITLVANGTEYTLSTVEQEIEVTGSSFELKGDNKGVLLKSLTITTAELEEIGAKVSTDFIFEEVDPSNSGDVEGGTTVGIDTIFNESAQDVYTLSGVLVRKQATNLNGLPKGVYVVGGQKVLVK